MPYNVERLLHIYSGADTELVKQVQGQMDDNGKATIPPAIHSKVDIISQSESCDRIEDIMSRIEVNSGADPGFSG